MLKLHNRTFDNKKTFQQDCDWPLGKMLVHMENLEISWGGKKFNKYPRKDPMKPGKTWWLLEIPPFLLKQYKSTKLLK